MLDTDEAFRRVTNGSTYLTDHYGQKWPKGIDWDRMDIGDNYLCIGAQLEGDYGKFCSVQALDSSQMVDFGLDMWLSCWEEIPVLNAAWRVWYNNWKNEHQD